MTNVLNTLIQKCKKNNTQIKNIQDKIHLLDNSLQETQQNHEKLNNLTNTELQIFKNKILEDLNIIKQTMQTITPLIPDEAINEVKESLKKDCEEQRKTHTLKTEHRLNNLEKQYQQPNVNQIDQTNKGTNTHTELYMVPFNHKYPESYVIHFLNSVKNMYNIIRTRGRATDV
uniref:Uncharacterized protein n=1 Tax=Clastoptera arizonana TaxID=38151 RepID=A0A1B6CYJ6_9HEMI